MRAGLIGLSLLVSTSTANLTTIWPGARLASKRDRQPLALSADTD